MLLNPCAMIGRAERRSENGGKIIRSAVEIARWFTPSRGEGRGEGRSGAVALALSLVAAAVFAQPVVVEYADDFQSYKTQSNVPGWVDTSVGSSKPEAQGLFKTWPDPLNKDNVVYGTKQSSGKPEGKNPRIGTFSTLSDRSFAGKGRFEYRGRFLRTSADSRVGLSFFSSYPEADRYYLVGLWSQESAPALTMQLFAFGGGAPAGAVDSGFTPPVDQWTRFLIQVDDVDGETRIRARFWPDGSSEPQTFTIDAVDTSPSRLIEGRIGIWAAVKGDAYVDDLHAKAPIDNTPPAIRFTGFDDGALIATPVVRIAGEADDAASIAVNGTPATIDREAKTFLSQAIRLFEGANEISAIGADEVGNRLTIALRLVLDTRAPEIAIAAPASGACLDVDSIAIAGTLFEPHLHSIVLKEGDASVAAIVDPANRTWSATLAAGEGPHTFAVEAFDTVGHRAILPRSVTVDRTPPALEIVTADGAAADGLISNRALSFFVRVADLDRKPGIAMHLGSDSYASGTPISAEGAYTITAAATDCAGHRTERSAAFTIDTTAPRFASFTPADGARVGAKPSSVTGTIDDDAVSIAVVGTEIVATPANGSFTLAGLTFGEGENRFLLRAIDRAGNVKEAEYRFTILTRAPSIEILDSGAPIADGALFNREIHPEIRISDPAATVTATLDGAPFASGAAIASDGPHTLAVTATDDLGHAATKQVSFTIDRTPPAIAITVPQAGRVTGESVVVEGTAADSASVSVNGIPGTLAGGAFSATVPIEEGDNVLVAIGLDAAGNSGRAEVVVTRDSRATGVITTSPADGFVTNRQSVRVTGRVLDPHTVAGVTVASTTVVVDANGAFELAAVPLAEGENGIVTVATSKSGGTTSATVRVVADRMPPVLRILESGQPLSDQSRFAANAALALEVSDERELRSAEARIDGSAVALPSIVTAAGGHTIVALAVDSAGNETRVERTFFIGGASGPADCALGSFNPPAGSTIASTTTGLTGRTGGAAGVKVNGIPAAVANGSFCATVELPAEGANTVQIACTDADGNATGEPKTLTLVRSTTSPSVSISEPPEGDPTAEATIRVAGTAGLGVVGVTVNGAQAAIAEGDPNALRAFSLDGVRLGSGLNVLLVRAKSAAGRSAVATRRVLYLMDAPALTITSPLPAQTVGSPSVALSGRWIGIDPATLAAAGSAASPEIVRVGDDSGRFLFRDVPLAPGDTTLTITGRDILGRLATASVTVRRDDAAPSIEISAPRDHAIFGMSASSLEISGTATAANGATIEVGGQPATIVSIEAISETRTRYAFTATAPFATAGPTPVVARVTDPAGRSAYHAIRVTKLPEAPKVKGIFPDSQAIGVDPGAMVVVAFTSAMDRASLRCGAGEGCAFRLETASGSPVSGMLDVDEDALTFAPAAPLGDGAEYTIRISTAAKDAGGVPLESEYVSRFRVGLAAAPSAAPVLDALPAKHCGSMLAVAGSAPAGARVQFEVGSLKLATTADASGRFRYDAPLTGESGYLLVRASTLAADGATSAAAHSCVLIDCGGLGISAATFDRAVNRLTIAFTAPVDLASANGESLRLLADGVAIPSAITLAAPAILTMAPSEDLTQRSFTLEVTTAIRGADGTPLTSPFSQSFIYDSEDPAPGDGTGFISGEIYDASTGRPLPGATITIATPTNAFGGTSAVAATTYSGETGDAPAVPATTHSPRPAERGEGLGERSQSSSAILSDSRGRYTLRLPEGAHTLEVSADGYTAAWRQIILPAGAGITPIDIRLTGRAAPATVAALPLTLTHGGEDAVTARATLEIPNGGTPTGAAVTFTSVGAQSLAGLLPLGWSPLGSAELEIGGGDLAAATLSFDIPEAAVAASGKSLSLVRYDADRDEWRVVVPVVNVVSGRAVAPIAASGTYALVYPDAVPAPSIPPGSALAASPDTCATSRCDPITELSFTLNPDVVLPDGTAVAALVVHGSVPFPSGTAVQAWIDEELRLTDGTTLLDPPFAADLILYRSLGGATASALFHLSPSARAAEVILEVGYDHVRVRPYPGRLARGTLIGVEGGRVPSDGDVVVEIPAGASPEPVRASASSLPNEDLAALGAIAGFRILGGVALELESAAEPSSDGDGDGVLDPAAPVVLLAPARITFHAEPASVPEGAQIIVAEILGDTPYGRIVRLAARAAAVPFEGDAKIFTTSAIDRSILPLDGVVREGRYLFLAAEAPIAFATGSVRRGATGPYQEGALVTAPPLGVADLTRVGGLFVIAVPAAPAQPFSVVARHTSIGEGTPRVGAASPERDAIIALGDLFLESQPPQISSTVPLNGATVVSLTTTVRVQFDRALDSSSIAADAIVVSGPAGIVAGPVTADGPSAIIWSLPPSSSLAPGAIYTARVSAQIRSSAGAPLGRTYSFSFSTLAEIWNPGEVRPERISITIPNASGLSTIRGTDGALPSGWQAVAVRRGRDFGTGYQATATANGSFAFDAGTSDPITISDIIDLHAINNAGNLAAIIPLTPFVNSEGTGFIAKPHDATTFTSKDGIAVNVPAGAFDTPVLVTVEPEPKTVLADVPNLDAELQWSGSVDLNLDCSVAAPSSAPCIAKEHIDLEIPVPPNTDPTGRIFLLGLLGNSVRGPRIMVVDTLRIEGTGFTTAPATTQGASVVSDSRLSTPDSRLAAGVQVNADVKKSLLGVSRSGVYSAVDVNVPPGSSFGWSLMDVTGGGYDLFNSVFESLYASSLYLAESRGRVAVPILTGTEFTITGYDSATGLKEFEKVYDPNPLADPGAVFAEEPLVPNTNGPYPVFGGPFRVEMLDVDLEKVDFEQIRNFVVRLEGNLIKVSDAPGGNALPAEVPVTLINPANGTFATRKDGLVQVPGKPGDRIVIFVRETNVDASSSVSLVFSEPIALGGATAAEEVDTFLKTRFTLEHRPSSAPSAAAFTDATSLARFSIDSLRRVRIDLPAGLQLDALYRLRISKELADEQGLKIMQYKNGGETKGGLAADLVLEFATRAPGGTLGAFDIRQNATTQLGAIRDLALEGNVMYVSALDGGLIAYDISDPASMTSAMPTLPLSYVSGALDDYWSAAVDHHGRVWAAALGNTFGVVRSFRAEQFLRPPGQAEPHVVAQQLAGGMVSWVPGYSSSLPMSTATVLSDRPEAIPRKVQVLVQDAEDTTLERDTFKQAWASLITKVEPLPGGAERLTLLLPIEDVSTWPYLLQRVTVENTTAALRASADARPGKPATIAIVAAPRDALRIVRNQRTYGVVSLFGYGVGIFDLNGLESNDAPDKPSGWKPLQEKIALTRASIEPDDSLPATWDVAEIPDLSFSPDAAIIPGMLGPNVFALDARRGILNVQVAPQPAPGGGMTLAAKRESALVFRSTLGSEAYDHPRLAQLRAKFKALAGREPFGRFNTIAPYSWFLSGTRNLPVAPGSKFGRRGSIAGNDVRREYTFVAGNEYGLLVVEAGGDSSATPFGSPQSLVDVIWIPAGAASVRLVPGWHVAAVIDGLGHLLLCDVSRIDERFDANGAPIVPGVDLFPTASASLSAKGTYGVGRPDPRILWRSDDPVGSGTLAPLVDPRTGFVYAGRLLQKKLEVIAALEPRLRVLVDLGKGLEETGGIVPLGVSQKGTVAASVPGALAAFRLEMWLPGGVANALPGGFRVAIESERVYKALAEQMPEGWPRAHLRLRRPDGTLDPRPATEFLFERAIPPGTEEELRHQSGYNRFLSPWIVAIADPRASEAYDWGNATAAQKEAAGCANCERPAALKGKTEDQGVWELWSGGRAITVRPELPAPSAQSPAPYDYLAEANRATARIPTIIADTVRPTEALIDANYPPVAGGAIEETVYVHSGELETGNVDLVAGGRAGFDVAFDRTYRSRTLGATELGQGWTSSFFRRLRRLPNGDVEYRDGAGEVWLFALGGDTYTRPHGLFLRLARRGDGWTLTDQKQRVSYFDAYGRLVADTDEFFTGDLAGGNGNVIRYLYDQDGKLTTILDPVGRATRLEYWDEGAPLGKAGRLSAVVDWRDRQVDYDYDAHGRLTRVDLIDVLNTSLSRPKISYAYTAATGSFNDRIEILTNLASITDPIGDPSRVAWEFTTAAGSTRDRVSKELWATGEKVSFDYTAAAPKVTDALGQLRSYELTPAASDATGPRTKIAKLTEHAVTTSAIPFGTLPTAVSAAVPETAPADRSTTFTYNLLNDGLLIAEVVGNIRQTTYGWNNAPLGFLLESTTVQPLAAGASKTATALAEPITRKILYQPNAPAFVAGYESNGLKIDSPESHRDLQQPGSANDGIVAQTKYRPDGLVESATSAGGTDPEGKGTDVQVTWNEASAAAHERALPKSIDRGGVETVFSYPDATTTVTTDPQGNKTTTKRDAWDRVIETTTGGAGLETLERFSYDASGRLARHERKQGGMTVATSYQYDAMGRRTLLTADNIAVDGALKSVQTSWSYNYPARIMHKTVPTGAIETTTLDGLGRVISTSMPTGQTAIDSLAAYDLLGNRVYSSDGYVASAAAYDIHGRQIATLNPDGTRTEAAFDAWDRPTAITTLTADDAVVEKQTTEYTPAGRIEETTTVIDDSPTAGESRTTEFAWDGAGRTTRTATEGRAHESRYDAAGRFVGSASGLGSVNGVSEAVVETEATSHKGYWPQVVKTTEKDAFPVAETRSYDTLGHTVTQKIGPLEWTQTFDQAGNVTEQALPERPASTFAYDARGAATEETQPDGAKLKFAYDALGAMKTYEDQVGEATTTEPDLLGRPLKRNYPDGTYEQYVWKGVRLESYRDRQGRTRVYHWNPSGQLEKVTRPGGEMLDHLEYDAAGRLVRWTNADTALVNESFDLEGRPRRTRQIRYRNATGHTTKEPLDEFVQEHRWSAHGERTYASMPAYPQMPTVAGATQGLSFGYDALGNLVRIGRAVTPDDPGTPLLTGSFRGAGRADERTIHTACETGAQMCVPAQIVKRYGYDPQTGQLTRAAVSVGDLIVAGSEVTYDGLQVSSARLLGVSSNERRSFFRYDDRGRLVSSVFATLGDAPESLDPIPGLAKEQLTPADFRTAQDRMSIFDDATKQVLQEAGIDPATIEPQTVIATESAKGHKIEQLCRGTECEEIGWSGGERTSDGRFFYEWDDRGRLMRVIEKPTTPGLSIRRIVYAYNGADRLVGRTAQYAIAFDAPTLPPESAWKLEDRPAVLEADRLPAETTFVWDPVTDQLIAAFRAGATGSMPHAGLLRQILHGGYAYDDPIEVTVFREPAATNVIPSVSEGSGWQGGAQTSNQTGAVAANSATPAIEHLYLLYDEAAGGTLQAILGSAGELRLRSVVNDPYGAEETELAGPMVDRVTIGATKNAAGALSEVRVTIGLTEAIAESTVSAGVRLATVDAAGKVVRLSTGSPTLVAGDPFRIEWVLNGGQWQELLSPSPSGVTAHSLSIAVTSALRATGWADVSVLPAPESTVATQSLRATAERPVEIEQSIASLRSWLGGLTTGATSARRILEVHPNASGLSGISGTVAHAMLVSAFHAAPFEEVLTGHAYFRARWLDHAASVFLSPDAIGYADSSNLYAFAGGNPLSRRDPTGLDFDDLSPDERAAVQNAFLASQRKGIEACRKAPLSAPCLHLRNKILERLLGDQRSAVSKNIGANAGRKGTTAVYVNGVWNFAQGEAEASAVLLADLYGRPFDVVWNPGEGLLRDLLQAGLLDKQELIHETTRLLIETIRSHLAARTKNELLFVVAHSQGAAILNAALQQMQSHERMRIDIVTYGGSARGFPDDLHSQRHVVNVIDPVPFEFGMTKEWLYEDVDRVFFVGTVHTVFDYVAEEKRNKIKRAKTRQRTTVRGVQPISRYSIQ